MPGQLINYLFEHKLVHIVCPVSLRNVLNGKNMHESNCLHIVYTASSFKTAKTIEVNMW